MLNFVGMVVRPIISSTCDFASSKCEITYDCGLLKVHLNICQRNTEYLLETKTVSI